MKIYTFFVQIMCRVEDNMITSTIGKLLKLTWEIRISLMYFL